MEVLSGAFGQKLHSNYVPVLTVMEAPSEYSGDWMFLHGVGIIVPTDELLRLIAAIRTRLLWLTM